MPNTPDTISSSPDSAVVQFTPAYPTGIPAAQQLDTVVQRVESLPLMETPKVSAPTIHSRGPLYDTGSMSLLLMSMLMIVVSFRSGYKYIENLGSNLFSVRKRRENAFATHTMGDMRMMMALVLNSCVLQGILLFYAIGYFLPQLRAEMQAHVFVNVGVLSGACLALHLLQNIFYGTLGYVFSDSLSRRLWLIGFRASQSVCGLLLFPVTAFLLLFPSAMEMLLMLAAGIYLLVKIVFILKGLRIFFNKISLTFYFILYLCSVEFVPLVIFAISLVKICTLLQS